MVAYDSRRTPDPSQLLLPETVESLKRALKNQPRSVAEPSAALSAAVRAAAREGRERGLLPEAIIIQLKALADEVGVSSDFLEGPRAKTVREWMVRMCLRAYWDMSDDG